MKAFLDTYALVEILNDNPTYTPYAPQAVTNVLNLYEFHFHATRLRNDTDATSAFRGLRSCALAVEDDDVLEASRFRRRNAGRGLSFADALGYTMAQRRGMPFVTGDKAFKGMDGVKP